MTKLRALLGIAVLAMFLVGCGDTTPNHLTVIDQSYTVKTWKSSDISLVQSLYHHILSLPKQGLIKCIVHPPGNNFDLIFTYDQDQVLSVYYDACSGVILGQNDKRAPDAQFISLLQEITQRPPVSCTPYPPTPTYPGDKGGCP